MRHTSALNKVRKTSLVKEKNKAWNMFSKYIRLKYVTDGENVTCYTCGKVGNWKTMQAGHGIAGRTNAILFLEDIVRPQCVKCNVFNHGRLDVFAAKLINEIGEGMYASYLQDKYTPLPMTADDFKNVYLKYKRLVEGLK